MKAVQQRLKQSQLMPAPQVSCNVKVEPMESSDSGNCSGDSTASGLALASCGYSTL